MKTHTESVEPRSRTLGNEVVAWRYDQLVGAGFRPRLALRLAQDARMDLHALIELAERGCPHALAARILAPLAP